MLLLCFVLFFQFFIIIAHLHSGRFVTLFYSIVFFVFISDALFT